MKGLNEVPIGRTLKRHASEMKKIAIRELFTHDSSRFKNFSLYLQGLNLDYSKNPITKKTLNLLFKLADVFELRKNIHALFSGSCVNTTENLPALHTALRDPKKSGLIVNNTDVLINIHAALDKMANIIEKINTFSWRGVTKKPITDIINLGIGGSNLGPLMAFESLKNYKKTSLRFHFISHVDPYTFNQLLLCLNPETSLFIITSKSFSTQETLINAKTALAWIREKIPEHKNFQQHFLAVTAQPKKAIQFGIVKENIFPLWNWIGGRFSVCSCIGLSLALAIGMENFYELLRGAHTLDQHFLTSPWEENMPVILGLLAIWQRNFLQSDAHIILPYDASLKYFPSYLQQLEMESNGKSIRTDNKKVTYATCPFIFGDIGLNGQHAFYQLFHQGTCHFSADFILSFYNSQNNKFTQHHQHTIANALSQSKALIEGHYSNTPYKNLPGNHANNILALDKLTPFTLGMLIALYEHKVFVQSVIWQINPFDQWGIEYGKCLSHSIFQALEKNDTKENNVLFDSSTDGLIKHYQQTNLYKINKKSFKNIHS